MKKILSILFLSSVLFSCDKHYSCTCTFYNDTEGNVGIAQTVDGGYHKNKNKAQDACVKKSIPADEMNNGRKCELK